MNNLCEKVKYTLYIFYAFIYNIIIYIIYKYFN